MRPRRFWGLSLALIAFAALVIAGCGASSSTNNGSNTTATIKVASASVGGTSKSVLTDTSGTTLYYFDPDTATTVACSGSCAQKWPPLLMASGDPGSATALSGTLTAVNTANGRQVLYNRHPLYHFSGDTGPGQANGDGINNEWHVATPDLAAPAAGPTNTPAPNPYNY